eukprot:6870986-Alexandrium_andersonii.AAC.1
MAGARSQNPLSSGPASALAKPFFIVGYIAAVPSCCRDHILESVPVYFVFHIHRVLLHFSCFQYYPPSR